LERAALSVFGADKRDGRHFSDVTPLCVSFSKLQTVRDREADPGRGAGSRGSPLLSSRIHPSGQLPTRRTLSAHHYFLFPEEQLGGSATEGKTGKDQIIH